MTKYYYCTSGRGHIWPSPMRGRPRGLITRQKCKEHVGSLGHLSPWYLDFVERAEQELAELETRLDRRAKEKNPRHVTFEECRKLWEETR